MTQPAGKPDPTRQRLIEAAGEIFAERGFHSGQVREICRRAHANIAAVNYHFGSKEGLYREVLQYSHACAVDLAKLQTALPLDAPPQEQLTAFVRVFFHSMLATGRPAWQGKLMAREIIDPTPALDFFVTHEISPKFQILRGIVAGCLGVAVDHPAVRWCAASVISQCLFWEHNRPIIQRLYPDVNYSDEAIDFIARHVTTFSLHALRGAASSLQDWTELPAHAPVAAEVGS